MGALTAKDVEAIEPSMLMADRWEQAATGLCAALVMELGYDKALALVERGKDLGRTLEADREQIDPLGVARHGITRTASGLARHLFRGRP
jgi:hypothetical protein